MKGSELQPSADRQDQPTCQQPLISEIQAAFQVLEGKLYLGGMAGAMNHKVPSTPLRRIGDGLVPGWGGANPTAQGDEGRIMRDLTNVRATHNGPSANGASLIPEISPVCTKDREIASVRAGRQRAGRRGRASDSAPRITIACEPDRPGPARPAREVRRHR